MVAKSDMRVMLLLWVSRRYDVRRLAVAVVMLLLLHERLRRRSLVRSNLRNNRYHISNLDTSLPTLGTSGQRFSSIQNKVELIANITHVNNYEKFICVWDGPSQNHIPMLTGGGLARSHHWTESHC